MFAKTHSAWWQEEGWTEDRRNENERMNEWTCAAPAYNRRGELRTERMKGWMDGHAQRLLTTGGVSWGPKEWKDEWMDMRSACLQQEGWAEDRKNERTNGWTCAAPAYNRRGELRTERMKGWMDGHAQRLLTTGGVSWGQKEWKDGWKDEQVSEWTDGWVDGWIDCWNDWLFDQLIGSLTNWLTDLLIARMKMK